MISRCYVIYISTFLILGITGCSNQQSVSAYTSEEINYFRKFQEHLTSMRSHMRNYDNISKEAKPPYDDPATIEKLKYELDQAVLEAQTIAKLSCPSPKFNLLCNDIDNLQESVTSLRNNMNQYFSSDLNPAYRQNIIDALNAITTTSQNIAEHVEELEQQYGKIQ